MTRFPVAEADTARRALLQDSLAYALALSVLTLIVTVLVGLLGVLFELPVLTVKWAVLLTVLMGGMTVFAILFTGLRNGRAVWAQILYSWQTWNEQEMALRHAVLPVPTPRAEESQRPILTSGVKDPQLIGGVDVEDLRLLCRYIARRGKWTAEVLEGFELPASHITLTNKDTRNGQGEAKPTTYKNIMRLFEEAGVLVERERGQTGRLTERDPEEMLRKIRGIGSQPLAT